MKGAYHQAHCWQYDIRIRNLESDLKAANLNSETAQNLKVSDFEFSSVPKEDKDTCHRIAEFIERHEWLGKMPTRPTHRFIATYQGHLAGVIVMATPNSFSNLLGANNRDLEKLISRGACISWSPKNLGSALVMFAVRWMAENTGFRFFTAYSDTEARELGTIYQACNFTYLGKTSGAREEYFDPEDPDKGWFSDRQFRKTSQIRKYAKELRIPWNQDWSKGDKVLWGKIPAEISKFLKEQAHRHRNRSEKRSLPSKHKYVYILGKDNRETKRLRELFRALNPDSVDLKYPKIRGPEDNTADNVADTAAKALPKNAENVRPAIMSEFLTVKEAASILRVSDWTIYNLVKSDPSFPFLNIGIKKKFVIESSRLNEWTKKRTKELFMFDQNLPTARQLLSQRPGVKNARF